MAVSWCKVASNLDSHPKIRKAGRNGREVFLFALRRNAEPGNLESGFLPLDQMEPWYLADQLMMDECDARDGLDRCVTAGLIKVHLDRYTIVGWESEWSKEREDGRKRTAKWRENKRLRDDVTSRDVTECHNVTGDLEETRLEEKREKKDLSGKPDLAASLALVAVTEINRLASRDYRADSDSVLKLCRALVKAKRTPEQVVAVIASKRGWIGDPKMGTNFRPATLLAAENFANYLDDIQAGPQRNHGEPLRQSADRPEARSPLMLAFDLEAEEAADAVA